MAESSPFPHEYLEDVKNVTTENVNLITGEFQATRYFHGPWSKRFDFIFEYLMVPVQFAGGITLYSVPQAYPDLPVIHVNDISIRGEGKASVNVLTDAPVFDRARLTVNYKQHNFHFAAEPITATTAYQNNIFIEEEHDEYADAIEIDEDKIKLDGVAGEATDKKKITASRGDLVLKQQYVIAPDFISLDFFKDKVNGSVFITPSGHVYNIGKLRYEGYTATAKIHVTNAAGGNFPYPVWEIAHRFAYDAIGWNNKYDFETGTIKAVTDLTGKVFFKFADLFDIFFRFNTGFNAADLAYIGTRLTTIENLMFTQSFPFTAAYIQNRNEIAAKLIDMGFRV